MKIAIIGGGQLARLLALSGLRFGFTFSFLVESSKKTDIQPIEHLGKIVSINEHAKADDVYRALGSPDVITSENEQVDIELLTALEKFCPVHPSPSAIKQCGDRHLERLLLQSLQIPTAPSQFVEERAQAATQEFAQFPVYAKSTRLAYDGRNQHILQNRADLIEFSKGPNDGAWILEEKIHFDREVSIIAARDVKGECVFYPVTENVHLNGILRYSVSPSPHLTSHLQSTMEGYATRILESLNYVGVLAIEAFVVGDNVVVNELAPRVHNSGHWTSSAKGSCQFENHVRAITGLALGKPEESGATGMVNLIGVEAPPMHLVDKHSVVYWYNKQPRPGRKVGHINIRNNSLDQLLKQIHQLSADNNVLPIELAAKLN
ncbi:5-(carboxyamino)imidazole ribonucleotide synthase [Aurantivibrio plasticivorans]